VLFRSVCSGDVGTIGTPALPGYTYQWSSDQGIGWNGPANPSGAQPQVTFLNQTSSPIEIEYYVEASDPLGCVARDTVRVTYEPATSSEFIVDPQPEACVGDTLTLIYNSAPSPGAFYLWNVDGGIGTTNGPGPHNITWSTPGTKIVSLAVFSSGCPSDTFEVPITINPIPSSTFILPDTVCEDEFNQIIYTGSASLGANFTWDVGNAVPPSVSGAGPHNLQWSNPGFQQVSLTVEENGCESPTTTRTTLVAPTPDNSFAVDDSICVGELMQISYTGTSGATASYSWNFGNGIVLSGSGAGPYQVFWPTPGLKSVCLQVTEGDCASPVNCQTVQVKGRPQLQIDPVDDQCFPDNAFTFNLVGGPFDTYQWNFGSSAVPATYTGSAAQPLPPTAVEYLSPGPKTVTVTIANDGCAGPDTAKVSFEVVPEPSATFTASANEVCGQTPIGLTYQGSDPDNSQTYYWEFGPGAIPSTSTLKNPDVVYTTPGVKSVTLTVTEGPCTVSSTQTIEVKQGPLVDAGLDQEFCAGEGGAPLDASTSGGTMPYFYTWTCDQPGLCGLDSVNVEDPMVNPDVANPTDEVVYYYFVTDVNGCRSNTDSVVVTVKAKPIVDAGMDRSICAPQDTGVFLGATPASTNRADLPLTYQWSPAAGLSDPSIANPYARPDTTTIYTVVATSANGCTSDATTVDELSSVTITVKDKPQAFAGPDVSICLGDSVELEGFATSAGPDYQYTWTSQPTGSLDDPTDPTPMVSPTQTTTYTLVVSANACDSDEDRVTVTVNPIPSVNPGPEASACLFEPHRLDALAGGGATLDSNTTYTWFPGTGLDDSTLRSPIATPQITTGYSVYATSGAGCVSDTARTLLVIKPTPVVDLMAQDSAICGDAPLTFTASHTFFTSTPPLGQINYLWFPQDFDFTQVDGQDSVVSVTPTRSGYITVQAQIAAGECPTRDSVFLNVDEPVVAEATADTTRICEGGSTALLASGGRGNSTYLWSPATGLNDPTLQAPTASPDTTTTYILAISEGICTSLDTITVAVNPSPEADYFNSIATGCGGLEVSFMENAAPGAIAYRWDFGDGSEVSNEPNPVHLYAEPGTYTVSFTAIGEGGCEETVSRQQIEVYDPATADFRSIPDRAAPIAVSTPIQFEDQSAEAVEWLWDFGDGTYSQEAQPTHIYEQPGSYTVTLTITDEAGCSSTISYGLYEIFVPEVELQNVFTPNGDGVNDEFFIDYPNPETFTLRVFDRWGREAFTAGSPSERWDGILPNGSEARSGVYLYTVTINGVRFNASVTLLR